MAELRTPDDVIRASGVSTLPEYTELVRFTDSPGFSARRDYPPWSELSRVLTGRGKPDICCLIHFGISRSQAAGGVRKMRFGTSRFSRWGQNRFPGEYDFSDPDCPTPESVHLLKRAPKPKDLTFDDGEFFYDTADGQFYDEDGRPVTGKQILDYLYDYHCRTLGRWFRIRSRVRDIYEHGVRRLLKDVQRAAGWLLEHGYDIQPTIPQKDYRFLFHKFGFADFRRLSDDKGTHFFGFESSKRSLFSNILLLAITCVAAYRYLPRWGFFRAVYHNAPLTTAALVFAFLGLDQAVPFVLKAIVCGVSRLRPMTLFFIRKVKL